jgi:soluble lytic murein transglycosylase
MMNKSKMLLLLLVANFSQFALLPLTAPAQHFTQPYLSRGAVNARPRFAENTHQWSNSNSLQLRQALQRRDYATVEKQLDNLAKSNPQLFRANNYEYLRARLAERQGKLAIAKEKYQTIIAQSSNLSSYAYWHLAQLAHEQGDFVQERKQLQQLIGGYANSRLIPVAKRQLADNQLAHGEVDAALNYFRNQANRTTGREALGLMGLALLKKGDLAAARATFEQLIANARDDQALLAAQQLDLLDQKSKRQASETELLQRGRIYLTNRDAANARRSFQNLLERFPETAARPEVLYATGRAYYIDYDYANAIRWYEKAYQEFPQTDDGERGFYHAGHALQNLGRFAEAVQRYQQVIDQYAKGPWVGGAHLNALDSLRSAGKNEEALQWCQRTMRRFAGEVTGTTALFAQAKIYLNQQDYRRALESLQLLLKENLTRRAPGATNRSEVEFLRALTLEKSQRYAEAVDAYLGFAHNRDNYYSNRATQRLQALASNPAREINKVITERWRQYRDTAQREYTAGNYSAAKNAAHQALRLTAADQSETQLLDLVRNCYQNLPPYRRFLESSLVPVGRDLVTTAIANTAPADLADELLFLGLYDEGTLELRRDDGNLAAKRGSRPTPPQVRNVVRRRNDENNPDPNTQTNNKLPNNNKLESNDNPQNNSATVSSTANWPYSLAVYSSRGSHAQVAIRYGESNFSNSLPDDFALELLHPDIAALLYPAAYPDEMTRAAARRNLDARFMLAIARQESRFNPQAKSPVAARGLFQFIPATAERIRQELKLTDFEQNDLYRPALAVNFASQYLGNLFDEFKDHPQAVAASYNGGEEAVRRWLDRTRDNEIDLFVVEVAYQETKDYVYKVLNNYWAYQRIYRGDLNGR